MSSVRLEVLWSPVHKNRFITWGTEIFLYETLQKKECEKRDNFIEISESTVARLLATNSNYHYMKCIDIYPKEEKDLLLAIGQANGKVVLTTFGPSKYDTLGLNGLELMPKHARQCNVVQWNKFDTNLIATGLDRYRSDHCILVWDVQSRQHSTVAELGLSDTAHSLCWLADQPRSLIIGMNNKTLKMVDLRDTSKGANSSQTKAVYGVTVPSLSSFLIASYVENQIAIWDIRSFEKPVANLQQSKPVTKILWCPTRNNLLGSLQRDSRSIHLHDVQQMEDLEPTVLERSVKPGSSSQITSFSWHPKDENRLLTITLAGAVSDYTMFERITLNWSQNCQLIWTQGQRCLKVLTGADKAYTLLGDLSSIMRKRALLDYGLKSELKDNAELVNGEQVQQIWFWLDHSKTLVDEGVIPFSGSDNKHPGIRSVLGMDNGATSVPLRSEITFLSWSGLRTSAAAKVFRSELRDRALSLCSWNFVHDHTLLQLTIEQLEEEGNVTKAAAIAVFGLQLKKAIKILSETQYNTVSMALSGYTDDKTSVWRESCVASRTKLKDPYLRAIFAFLTSDSDNYDLVVNEQGMDVADRIGFALTFLSDSKLCEFISQLSDTLTAEGNLAGILLTGMCAQVLPLLQNYLDNSGDVQSVSVVAMRAFPASLLEHERAQYWINCYRELLDMWTMWTQRAQFDIWHNSRSSTRPEQQVFVSCNFCGKSVCSYRGLPRNKAPFQRAKMSCCPNCRKPQPRCAICLIHMGTASSYQPEISSPPNVQMNPFDYWYCWCQTCRHGGHVAHINQWFKEHQECPVTECSCRCFSLDAVSNTPSISSVS